MSDPRPGKETTVYHLRSEHDGLTLAGALKNLIADSSWNQVKRWVAKRHVQVNGNLCLDEARRVKEKDVIKFHRHPQARPVADRDIRIAHIDEFLVVVEKPAGITSVRTASERSLSTRRRQLQPTLDELLPLVMARMLRLRWPPLPPKGMNRGKRSNNLMRSGELARSGNRQRGSILNARKLPPELQVFPVHRLDRDTSGLMLFARTRVAENELVKMFRRHKVERDYTAVCQGEVDIKTIRSDFVRDRGDGIRGSLDTQSDEQAASQQVQSAVTHIVSCEPVARDYSLVKCRLETGRTHQIRIHLSEDGHPVCGDKIYHRLASGELLPDKSGAPRQALHSHCLRFQHPFTEEQLAFEMALPRDLKEWISRLTNNS